MDAFILSEVEQGVMTITLNRPDRLNSFNDLMHQQLAACLTQAERDDNVRCLLITGAGRGFCAGQDLNDRNVDPSGPAPDLGLSVERFYNPLVRRLAALPKPVIAAVNGVAAGAGATLALGCDIVLAARSANFVMAFSKLGLVPDCGGSWFLPRVAGRARAMGLALLGEKLSAEQAAQWGMPSWPIPVVSWPAIWRRSRPSGWGLSKKRSRSRRPTASMRSWILSATISVWPDAAMTIGKASVPS